MTRFDEEMTRKITDAVGAAEARSGLEIVVRIEPRSTRYRDVALAAASAAALLCLCAMVYLPISFQALWLVPEVVLVGTLIGWLVSRSPGLIRVLTFRQRREDEVLNGAQRCFVTHALSGTRDRTGVLVYVSVLEDRVLVLPDFGAEGAISAAEWARLNQLGSGGVELSARLLEVLGALQSLGQAYVPRRADDTNELANEPSIG